MHALTGRDFLTRWTTSRAFVAWLVVALLCAQALGFHHAIEHAGRLDGLTLSEARAALTDADDGADAAQWAQMAEHSCAAFDAATLAASAVTTVDFHLAACAHFAAPASRVIPAPRSPLALGYRSRAPPLSILA